MNAFLAKMLIVLPVLQVQPSVSHVKTALPFRGLPVELAVKIV